MYHQEGKWPAGHVAGTSRSDACYLWWNKPQKISEPLALLEIYAMPAL